MDFRFNDRLLYLGGASSKFGYNKAALSTLRYLEQNNQQADPKDQWELAHYSGFGDSEVSRKIYDLDLTPEESQSLHASRLNAHYTSQEVLNGIWRGLSPLLNVQLVLDPSAGIGHFRSSSPDEVFEARWVEIELDLLTARILKQLHPDTTVINAGFEHANLPDGSFDLVISNFPFGNYGVADSRYKRVPFMRESVHNYFFGRSLDMVRPGGLVVGITSRYTMDATSSQVRKYLAERAELLAAVRLPGGEGGAFKANAGTEVTTDILVLRRRPAQVSINSEEESWVNIEYKTMTYQMESSWNRSQKTTYEISVPVNRYFVDHPEYILGKESLSGSMYAAREYTVEGDGRSLELPIAEALQYQLNAYRPLLQPASQSQRDTVTAKSQEVAITEKPTDPRVKALTDIFVTAKELIRQDAEHPLSAINSRAKLNKLYNEFVAAHGTLRSNIRFLPKGCPEAPFLLALEHKDGSKAALFDSSTVRQVEHIDSPTAAEALVMCLNHRARVDIDYIASLTGTSRETAIEELNGLVFEDKPDHYVTAEEYLSGDVKTKLNDAVALATLYPKFKHNVDTLLKVQPKDKGPGQIQVRLGAPWINVEYIKEFVNHLIDVRVTISHNAYQNRWVIKPKYSHSLYRNTKNYTTWGTHRFGAIELIETLCNGGQIAVYDRGPDDERILNQAETIAAQQKASDIQAEFQRWIWLDAVRSDNLVNVYNERFNRLVPCEYNGDHLTIPGLSEVFVPYPSQLAGVWRVLKERTPLLDHEVGMGKTLTGIIASMEAIRMGLANKVLIVVPNHLVGDWESAVIAAYPGCNVITATKDTLNKRKRPEWMARVATGNWDIVICPNSSFKLLDVRPATLAAFIQEEADKVEDYLDEIQGNKDSGRAQKELQRALKRLKAKLENLYNDVERDDPNTITFEELGIDMLIVDEIHEYKKLEFHTKMGRIAGLGSGKGSQMSFDLFVKSRWLVDRGGRFVGMTGTPLTNTIAEVFTWQRFFSPQILKDSGLEHFDSWFATFAVSEPALEMTPDGAGFRMHTRVRKFVNVQTLSQMWSQFCDHRIIEKGGIIQRPDLHSGHAVKVTSDGGPDLKRFIQTLAERAEAIHRGGVDPKDDNMLLITTEGRRAAIRPKLPKLCDQIARVHQLTTPVKGTQVVFLDIGTPKAKKNDLQIEDDDEETESEMLFAANAYHDIREMLLERGVPGEQIAFIHSAKDNAAKAKIFKDVNDGRIRVLLGSTGKMGTGMNVQKRLVALHQVDPTWRPDQMEQRLGRMLRQGNLWPEVFEFCHITAGSFDGYMWQTLETKAIFRAQFSNGAGVDEVEDISDQVLSYSDIKGTASGNPKVMERVATSIEVQKLDGLRMAHRNSLWSLKGRLNDSESSLRWTHNEIGRLQNEIDQIHKPEEFEVILAGKTYTKREDAAHKLRGILASKGNHDEVIGVYCGMPLRKVNIESVGFMRKSYNVHQLTELGIWQSMGYTIRELPARLERAKNQIPELEQQIVEVKEKLEEPFQYQDQFEQAKARLAQLDKELGEDAKKAAKNAEQGLIEANKVEVDDSGLEAALTRIEEMMQDPIIMARFDIKPKALPVVVEQPKPAPKAKPVPTGQLELPGFKMVEVVVKPKKKRKDAKPSGLVQMGFVFES